jgi:hypothetical protein
MQAVESSTDTACGPVACWSISMRPRLGSRGHLRRRADLLECRLPGERKIFVGLRIVTQRRREAPILLQVMIGPTAKLGQGMLGEEFGRRPFVGDFPGGRLGAILAELEGLTHI